MAELSAEQTDRATSAPIHDLGSAFMLHKDTMARGADNGFENPFAFYFAGRGGVLGDVDADVIYSAFGWFSPTIVRPMWEAGIAVHGARSAASRYFVACAEWGRDHLAGVDGLDLFADMAERLVDVAETSGRSLFAAWNRQPRDDDGPGRAMQLVHVLREWRGANHLVATTAMGLAPLESVVTDRPGQARFMGWPEPYPDPTDELRKRHDEAEALTDRLCAPAFEALSADERVAFADIVPAMFEAATT